MLSNVKITEREQKRIYLLKFHAMHTVNGMPWSDCAAVYEAETGKKISDDQLRLRVKRAVHDTKFVRVTEFPKKVVVSAFELTVTGCIWCAIRKLITRMLKPLNLQKRLHFHKNRHFLFQKRPKEGKITKKPLKKLKYGQNAPKTSFWLTLFTVATLFWVLLCVVFAATSAFGDTLQIYAENDWPWDDDSDYTHGTRIEYSTDVFRFGAQQQMYTPYSISTEDQVEGRHPYAGTLVGFAGWRPVHRFTGKTSIYGDYELQIGVLGPSSLAEQTQRYVHKWIGAQDPKGWDHQLHDEIIVQTALWEGFDWRFLGREAGWSAHLDVEAGGMLGTLQIAPGANADLKFGYGIQDNDAHHELYVRSVRPVRPRFSAYAIAGCSGRWWLRNELLDGNAHYVGNHDTLTVEKEPLTGCLKAGFGAKYGKIEVRMLWMWWTREFKTQESTPNYASVSIGYDF